MLISDYLSYRYQSVKINDTFLRQQGSTRCSPRKCFGPLFFILVINDFPDCVVSGIIFTYYDDMKLLPSSTNPILIQIDIDSLSTYTQLNALKFDQLKSKILRFGSTHDTSFHLNGSMFEQMILIKDLRLLIAYTLI